MRIWAFGCSFTQYSWPTWADILIHEARLLGIAGHNLGKCGAGNQFIASRIWECNARYTFSEHDWIFICWTGFNREDRFITSKGWQTPGNIGTQNVYSDEYVRTWADERHYAMRDCMLITSTLNGLKQLGATVVTWTMNPYRQTMDSYSFHTSSQIVNILDTYKLEFSFPSMMEFMDTVNQDLQYNQHRLRVTWDNIVTMPEFHPLPIEHLGYLQKFICNEVSWASSLSNETIEFVHYWEERLHKLPKPVLLSGSSIGWQTPVTLDLWN